MERFVIRKRKIKQPERYLYEQLLILSSLSKYHSHIGDKLSFCLRICLLNDLYFNNSIEYNNIIITKTNTDLILNEALCILKNKDYSVKTAIKVLNGETGSGIKNLRRKILKKLENENILKYKVSIWGFKIEVEKYILDGYVNRVLEYLIGNEQDLKYDVLVCCLDFMGLLGKLSQTEKIYFTVKKRVTDILDKIYQRNNLPSISIRLL